MLQRSGWQLYYFIKFWSSSPYIRDTAMPEMFDWKLCFLVKILPKCVLVLHDCICMGKIITISIIHFMVACVLNSSSGFNWARSWKLHGCDLHWGLHFQTGLDDLDLFDGHVGVKVNESSVGQFWSSVIQGAVALLVCRYFWKLRINMILIHARVYKTVSYLHFLRTWIPAISEHFSFYSQRLHAHAHCQFALHASRMSILISLRCSGFGCSCTDRCCALLPGFRWPGTRTCRSCQGRKCPWSYWRERMRTVCTPAGPLVQWCSPTTLWVCGTGCP